MKTRALFLLLVLSSLAVAAVSSPSRPLTTAEISATLKALCAAKINPKTLSCLPKTEFYRQIERSDSSRLELSRTGLSGAFSRAGARQIVASADFLDADGLPERFVAGVSVLLEAGRVVRLSQDLGSDGCTPFPRGDGRDLLTCTVIGFGQGYSENALEWRDLGRGAKSVELFRLTGNSGTCQDPLEDFEISSMTHRDTNRDGRADLVVEIAYRTAPNPNCDVEAAKLPARRYRLVFLWNGSGFKPDAASAALLKGWR